MRSRDAATRTLGPSADNLDLSDQSSNRQVVMGNDAVAAYSSGRVAAPARPFAGRAAGLREDPDCREHRSWLEYPTRPQFARCFNWIR